MASLLYARAMPLRRMAAETARHIRVRCREGRAPSTSTANQPSAKAMPLGVAVQCPVHLLKYLLAGEPVNAMHGAVDLGDGLTPIDIWQGLHSNARAWSQVPYGAGQNQDRTLIDGTDLSVLKALADYPASKWAALCNAAGMTVYGAVALSWCKDAEIKDVWEGWEASGFPLRPLPEFERPARFINSAFMPKTRSLKGIVDEMGNSSLAICAAIASSPEPLEFDLDPNMMKSAKPQLASFLKSRMLEKPDRTAEEEALLKVWSEAVKDTEYDIWEGS